MKTEPTTQHDPAPRASGHRDQPEAATAQRFARLLAKPPQTGPIDPRVKPLATGRATVSGKPARKTHEGQDSLADALGIPAPVRADPKPSSDAAPGVTAAAPRETPAPTALPASPAGGSADAAAFSAMVDRVHAGTGNSAETQLTLSDSRWIAQSAQIVAAPDGGGIALTLEMRNGDRQDQAATHELRRRLAARGIAVSSIATMSAGTIR